MDNEVKKLNCIVCPMGCEITVEIKNKKIEKIEGNTCRRGELYVKEELTAPRRMLTASVRVKNGALPLLPVVSNATLPKEKILCQRAFRKLPKQKKTLRIYRYTSYLRRELFQFLLHNKQA